MKRVAIQIDELRSDETERWDKPASCKTASVSRLISRSLADNYSLCAEVQGAVGCAADESGIRVDGFGQVPNQVGFLHYRPARRRSGERPDPGQQKIFKPVVIAVRLHHSYARVCPLRSEDCQREIGVILNLSRLTQPARQHTLQMIHVPGRKQNKLRNRPRQSHHGTADRSHSSNHSTLRSDPKMSLTALEKPA